MAEQEAAPIGLERNYAGGLDTLYRRYVVQETYVRVAPYQAAGVIRHPRAFLLRVASNITRDHLRLEKRRLAASGAVVPAEPLVAGGHQAAEQMAALQLKEIILALPAPYRDVFVLSRFGGLTYEEIAHHCGLSVKTVEWRMKKALAFCARRLLD